jgi:hypothetical protein
MSNVRKLKIAGRWHALSKMLGCSRRARVEHAMNDQRRYLQGSNLFHQSWVLSKAVAIFTKNPIDLEIDVEAIDKKLSS